MTALVPNPSAEPADALTTSPLPQLRRLVVTVSEQEVVITGRVPSFYFKQLAQETLKPSLGLRRLRNRVEVCTMG
ncbi:MAG: BON domain-containing protein [Gemmataceae bacterium]